MLILKWSHTTAGISKYANVLYVAYLEMKNMSFGNQPSTSRLSVVRKQGNFSFPSAHEAKAFCFALFFLSCLKLNPKDLATL